MFTHTQKHSVCVCVNINGNSSGSSNGNATGITGPGRGDGMIYILTHRWAKNEPAFKSLIRSMAWVPSGELT